jgi:predicted dienelactone hydrolase
MPVTPVALVAEKDHSLIGQAENILVSASTPVISISPVTIYVPGCIVSLQVRVSAPTTGNGLPIILFSHGHDPLCNFWAAHGFVVIQPTHLSSKSLSLDPTTLGAPLFWRSRAEDMRHILDELDLIEASVPGLRGRLDRSRVAIAGHSLGGHTAAMLMGARLTDPKDGSVVDMIEPRF